MNLHYESFKSLLAEIFSIKKDQNGKFISPHTLENDQLLTYQINPYSNDILLNEISFDTNINKWCSFYVKDVFHHGIFRIVNEHYCQQRNRIYYILELVYLPIDTSSNLIVGHRYSFPKNRSTFNIKGRECGIYYYLN